MGDVEIRGGYKADAVARAIDKAVVAYLRRDLRSALTRGSKPMRRAAKDAALEKLPHGNGLNVLVAKSRINVNVSGGASPQMKIRARGIDQIDLIDEKGIVAHPTYGHRPRVVQAVAAGKGWFTDTMQDHAPDLRRELEKAIDDVARRIEAAGG